jgi:hypothetical protein
MITLSKILVDGSTSFTNFISYEQNKILYKVMIDEVTQYAFKIDIQGIQNRADFSEQTFWGIDKFAINEYKKSLIVIPLFNATFFIFSNINGLHIIKSVVSLFFLLVLLSLLNNNFKNSLTFITNNTIVPII